MTHGAVARVLRSRHAALGILLALIVFSWVTAAGKGGLDVQFQPDSIGYRALAEAEFDPIQSLNSIRPPVYPAIVSLSGLLDRSYELLPELQYTFFSAAVVALFFTLVAVGFRAWEALLATAPLPQSAVLAEFGPLMLSEISGTSLAIISVSVSLLLSARGPSARRNLMLALIVFVTVLTRPAFLFLVVMCPLAILLLSPAFRPGKGRRHFFRELFPNAMASVGPLVAYSAIRWAVVGHFGLVSFGGVSLAGFATNAALLNSANVSRLPTPELRSLGRKIIDKRESVATQNDRSRAHPSFIFDSTAIRHVGQYQFWSQSYDPSLWEVSIPATREFFNAPSAEILNPAWIQVNRSLKDLSVAVLRREWKGYLQWIGLSYTHTMQTVFRVETAGRWGIGLCLVMITLILLGGAARQVLRSLEKVDVTRRGAGLVAGLALVLTATLAYPPMHNLISTSIAVTKGTILGSLYPLGVMVCAFVASLYLWIRRYEKPVSLHGGSFRRALAFGSLAFFYFASGLFLVVLVEVPWNRYVTALAVLMPGAVLLLSFKSVVAMIKTSGISVLGARGPAGPLSDTG